MSNPLLERLRYHVTGAIERGAAEPIIGIPQMPLPTEKEMEALEALVDRHTLAAVLDMLADICSLKDEHLRTNWQDSGRAPKAWAKLSTRIIRVARAADAENI